MLYDLMAYSSAYPFITQRIRASVRLQTDPEAIIASIIDTTTGHPQRLWTFNGLQKGNYRFILEVIDTAGDPVTVLQDFSIVPSDREGMLERADEQVVVGVTPNLNPGASDATFDGTNGSPDYRGWDIVPSELTGRGILDIVRDYDWDQVTGHLVLVQTGDVFSDRTTFNIHFNPKVDPTPNPLPSYLDFDTLLLTTAQNLTADMFGKKVLIELVGVYGEFTLPAINTVPTGRKIMIEVGGSNYCIKIIQSGSDVIRFLRGNIYVLPNEKVSIYKFKRPDNTLEWRVCDESPGFSFCGLTVFDDSVLANSFNKHLADGEIVLANQYARIYNEIVLNLPSAQRCNFDDWNTGLNKYLFSLANSSNPTYLGKFHFPDRRGLTPRANNTGKAGDFLASMVGPHKHPIWGIKEGTDGSPNGYVIRPSSSDTGTGSGQGGLLKITDAIDNNTGTETRPDTLLLNQYILL